MDDTLEPSLPIGANASRLNKGNVSGAEDMGAIRSAGLARTRLLAVLAPIALLNTCGGDTSSPTVPPQPPATPVPTSVSVSPSSSTLAALGATAKLTAEVGDQNGRTMSAATVTWSSSATRVATVDGTGLATASGNGSATVTATAGSATGTASVTVRQIPAEVLPEPQAVVFRSAGDTATLTATVNDANGHAISDAEVGWMVADTAVATVDTAGLVTALSPGQTEVIATSGNTEGTASLTVEFLADSISIAPSRLNLSALGDTATLSATVLDARGNAGLGIRVQWETANPLVADVDADGLVSAIGNGTTTISATIGELAESIPATVAQVGAAITIDPESLTFLAIGDTASVSATVLDGNGNALEAGAIVAWSSPDPTIASVTPAGLVTAVGEGATEVVAAFGALAAAAKVGVHILSGDREVLEFLYRAMGGEDWNDDTNWATDAPLGNWFGVLTNRDGRVTRLAVRGNNLTGPIPAAIGSLDQLDALDLSTNSLTGQIPPEIARLGLVRIILLGENDLTGSLPAEMGGMSSLESLHVAHTRLVGPVPETFANLNLRRFLFYNTDLCIPPSLDSWLETVDIAASDPVRCIPETGDRDILTALYDATGGANWSESERWLSPTGLNTWFGVETNEDGYVTELVLPANNLVGELPAEVGDLVHLERLILYQNDLSGEIPPEFGQLTKVRDLSLSGNDLEGDDPAGAGRHGQSGHPVPVEERACRTDPPGTGQPRRPAQAGTLRQQAQRLDPARNREAGEARGSLAFRQRPGGTDPGRVRQPDRARGVHRVGERPVRSAPP